MTINGKSQDITLKDLLTLGNTYSISRPERIVENIQDIVSHIDSYLRDNGVNDAVINIIQKELNERPL